MDSKFMTGQKVWIPIHFCKKCDEVEIRRVTISEVWRSSDGKVEYSCVCEGKERTRIYEDKVFATAEEAARYCDEDKEKNEKGAK